MKAAEAPGSGGASCKAASLSAEQYARLLGGAQPGRRLPPHFVEQLGLEGFPIPPYYKRRSKQESVEDYLRDNDSAPVTGVKSVPFRLGQGHNSKIHVTPEQDSPTNEATLPSTDGSTLAKHRLVTVVFSQTMSLAHVAVCGSPQQP